MTPVYYWAQQETWAIWASQILAAYPLESAKSLLLCYSQTQETWPFLHPSNNTAEKDESDDEDDVDKNDDNIITINDIEPCLKKVEEAMDKVNVLLQKQTSILKCDTCDFEARNVNGLTMHKKAKHTDNAN